MKNKKQETITFQSASSSPFSASLRDFVPPLPAPSPSDGLCRDQTGSPAAGRLQTIVLIPLFCSLPTWQLDAELHLLSLQGCCLTHKSWEWGKNTEERGKKSLLSCSFTCRVYAEPAGAHAVLHFRDETHMQTHTHIRPTCCISGPRLSLFAFVAPWSLLRCSSSSLFFNLWPSFCAPPPYPHFFPTHAYTHMGLGARLVKVCDGKRVQRVHAHVCVCMSATMREGNCVWGGRGEGGQRGYGGKDGEGGGRVRISNRMRIEKKIWSPRVLWTWEPDITASSCAYSNHGIIKLITGFMACLQHNCKLQLEWHQTH